ncbi:signal peptide peptidase SppA [Candidatus Dependentiae bacterium]|nr:signal peptide peptidase SppA [Candidatus Dependentiae bacterium]
MIKFLDILKSAFWILLLIQIAPPIIHKVSQRIFDTVEPRNKVGLILINSTITTSTTWNKQLRKFFKDPEIKAILIKLDSSGGAAGSSEAISKEIIDLKKDFPKPIVAYAENICASGAYMIAATTDYIIAPSSAIIGSIGAKISTQFKLKEFFEKYDVKTHSISSGTYKNSLDPFVDMTEEQQKMLQNLTNDSYKQFVLDISKLRHLNVNDQNIWADGKVFTGNEALKLRLIDEIGNQSTAQNYIKKHILHEDREIDLIKPYTPSKLEKLLHPDADEDDDEIQNKLSISLANLQSIWRKYYIAFE